MKAYQTIAPVIDYYVRDRTYDNKCVSMKSIKMQLRYVTTKYTFL